MSPKRTRVRIPRAGGYEVLALERDDAPTPGPGEVRVAVRAAGVNYADCIVRMGLYSSAQDYVGWPITPGFEIAGVIDAVGPGVDAVDGARVIAVTRFGGYASHVVVPARQVYPLPEGRTFEEGATFPAVFLTAWYALEELARPRPGQRVLVHSAAGGVGSAAIQLARARGCGVVGVVGGAHKVETARALGCDAVIDKSSEDLWPAAERHAPGGYDVVLDANGVSTLAESYAHLRRPGKLVVYGFASMLPRAGEPLSWPRLALDWARTPRFDPMVLTAECKSVLAFNLSYLFDEHAILRDGMDHLMRLWEGGTIEAPPITTYPLTEVAAAQRAIEGGATVGKLALTWEDAT